MTAADPELTICIYERKDKPQSERFMAVIKQIDGVHGIASDPDAAIDLLAMRLSAYAPQPGPNWQKRAFWETLRTSKRKMRLSQLLARVPKLPPL